MAPRPAPNSLLTLAGLAATVGTCGGTGSSVEPGGATRRDLCIAAYTRHGARFRELSAVIMPDWEWDAVQRAGDPAVCLGEGHRFYFVLLQYHHWKTSSTTCDFGVCAPQSCDDLVLMDVVLPNMYSNFFAAHTDYNPDGSISEELSITFRFTLKEYRLGLVMKDVEMGQVLFALLVCVIIPILITVLDGVMTCFGAAYAASGPPLLVRAFSVRRGLAALTLPGPQESSDLCRLRVGLTAVLLTLHVTQGSKWRSISALENSSLVFALVRPLALVNDAFILMSVYLCAWGSNRVDAERSATFLARLRHSCWRIARKYARQVPLCVFWAWVYVAVLPTLPYNMYNHEYPWFGIKWYQNTIKCMDRRWQYSLLLGDVVALLLGRTDTDWQRHNGNACANLWNFQLEIEAFAASAVALALPRRIGSAALAAVAAVAAAPLAGGADPWFAHHARGAATLLLALRALGLPHAGRPPRAWRSAAWPGAALVAVALATHGVTKGDWWQVDWLQAPPGAQASALQRWGLVVATACGQAALAVGLGLVCESCRAAGRSAGPGQAGPWLTAANRLCFGVNVAHTFVQFWVEAHASLHVRVFTLFAWLSQLAAITALSGAVGLLAYLLVQRPWAVLLDGALDVLHGTRRPPELAESASAAPGQEAR